jgi:two-component system, OmpR family, response regulator
MNILIIQKDHSEAEILAEAILSWGHDISWARTGAEALGHIKMADFDLIVMDVLLPDIHGDELIPRLKAFRPEAAIVTMTDNNSRDLELKVRKQGIICYMVKPVSLSILKNILDHRERKIQRQDRKFHQKTA